MPLPRLLDHDRLSLDGEAFRSPPWMAADDSFLLFSPLQGPAPPIAFDPGEPAESVLTILGLGSATPSAPILDLGAILAPLFSPTEPGGAGDIFSLESLFGWM